MQNNTETTKTTCDWAEEALKAQQKFELDCQNKIENEAEDIVSPFFEQIRQTGVTTMVLNKAPSEEVQKIIISKGLTITESVGMFFNTYTLSLHKPEEEKKEQNDDKEQEEEKKEEPSSDSEDNQAEE